MAFFLLPYEIHVTLIREGKASKIATHRNVLSIKSAVIVYLVTYSALL